MSIILYCAECKDVLPREQYKSKKMLTREQVGNRLLKLALMPINKYDMWCVDCIIDDGCKLVSQ